MTSWGLYLVAAVALILIISPQLSGVALASREGADARRVDGLRSVLDSLRPGITAVLSYGGAGTPPIHIGGHQLTWSHGGVTHSVQSRWSLPAMTLSPGASYAVSLDGTCIVVLQRV